jgi:hypothetical protein
MRKNEMRRVLENPLTSTPRLAYIESAAGAGPAEKSKKGVTVKRLNEMERLLGEWLLPGTRKERRKPLKRRDILLMAAEGAYDYLYDRTGYEASAAEAVINEMAALPDEEVGRLILEFAKEVLADCPAVLRFIKNRAPYRLGRAYAIYRLHGHSTWAKEDLIEDYYYYRKEL